MTTSASAPASSGNLGPGFDALALALELRCHVEARPSDEWRFHEHGEVVTPQPGDRVVRAVSSAVDRPMELTIRNEIPRSRGLGSSAAVCAAAACAALRAVGREPDPVQIFELVTELEGHADNAAAAVFGGLVIARDEAWRPLPLAGSLRFVFAVPDAHLSTHMARGALPSSVPLDAAARNVGRVGMLIDGLRTGDAATLRLAAGDELHEGYRAHLSPMTVALMAAGTGAGAHHTAWSGAGPTVLMITDDEGVDAVMAAADETLDGAGRVVLLEVATEGVR